MNVQRRSLYTVHARTKLLNNKMVQNSMSHTDLFDWYSTFGCQTKIDHFVTAWLLGEETGSGG